MEFKDKLRANFAVFDYKIVDESVFNKFAEICNLFGIDEDGIVENWIEFVDEDKNKSSSTDITAEKVAAFENWCARNVGGPDIRDNDYSDREVLFLQLEEEEEDEEEASVENKIQNKKGSEILEQSILNASTRKLEEDDDILEMYGLKKDPTKNIQHESSFADPEIHGDKENDDENLNASTTQSKSGEIVLKFGFAVSDWNNASPRESQIKRKGFPHVAPLERLLHNRMMDFMILNDLCCLMSRVFCEIWQKDKEQFVITSNVREKTFNKFRTWGRIISDNNGKITTTSILLMGDPEHWYHSIGEYEDLADNEFDLDNVEEEEEEVENEENDDQSGEPLGDPQAVDIRKKKECIPLDISRLKCYSFFPGQVIGVEGKNPTKDILCAYKVIPGISFGPEPPELNKPLQIMIAAGPFTAKPSDYQQLYNLMAHVARTKPNILILIGPFITETDVKPPQKDMLENLITKIMSYVDGKSTQVVLVSSYEDVLHDGFYPTPEYRIRDSLLKPNLHLMPDPCTIEIDGLIVGITSVDIIRHLSSEEISYKMPQRDRLGRIAEHLLLQSSYYPLYPPAQEVPLDLPLWAECSTMNSHPHILLVPSAMQYFYKYSNGTHIINPSKVSKGLYSQFNVRVNDQWNENSIGGEILRI